jgi:hypothetical protein
LLHPFGELSLNKLVALIEVEVADFLPPERRVGFAAARLAAAFFAIFAGFLDVRLAIAFTPTDRSST